MKIRVDFVTNSSSSSFVAITVFGKNGKEYTFGDEGSLSDENFSLPEVNQGKLVTEKWSDEKQDVEPVEITSVEQLMDVLFSCTGIDMDEEFRKLEYGNLKQDLETLQDIQKIEIASSDSAWDGEVDGDEDVFDEDGILNTEVAVEKNIIDLTELDPDVFRTREEERIEAKVSILQELKNNAHKKVNLWNIKDDLFPLTWELKIGGKDVSKKKVLLENLKVGDTLRMEDHGCQEGTEFYHRVIELLTKNNESLMPDISFPFVTADVEAPPRSQRMSKEEYEKLGVISFSFKGSKKRWKISADVSDYVAEYIDSLEVRVADITPPGKQKSKAKYWSLAIVVDFNQDAK